MYLLVGRQVIAAWDGGYKDSTTQADTGASDFLEVPLSSNMAKRFVSSLGYGTCMLLILKHYMDYMHPNISFGLVEENGK